MFTELQNLRLRLKVTFTICHWGILFGRKKPEELFTIYLQFQHLTTNLLNQPRFWRVKYKLNPSRGFESGEGHKADDVLFWYRVRLAAKISVKFGVSILPKNESRSFCGYDDCCFSALSRLRARNFQSFKKTFKNISEVKIPLQIIPW